MGPALLQSKWMKAGLLVAGGIGIVAGCVLFRRYKTRKSLYHDIEPDHAITRKEKLKRMLRAPNVHTRDMDRLEEIIDNLILGGAEELQIVADFDRTLTALQHDGKPVPSCHCVIEHSPGLPDWFAEKSNQMREYYLAIEVNPNMTVEEKYPFMEKWVDEAHDLLVQCNLHHKNVEAAVAQSNLYLREGGDQALDILHKADVPLLVFSAGVGDVIDECFKQRYKMFDNMHIIANWMDFNHQGFLVGFKGGNIHVFNKNTHAIENSSYFENIRQRHNVILLGDSLGDLDIAEGITVTENILTIGFLNHHVEEALPEYLSKYDVVLSDEPTLNLLNCLLENILSS